MREMILLVLRLRPNLGTGSQIQIPKDGRQERVSCREPHAGGDFQVCDGGIFFRGPMTEVRVERQPGVVGGGGECHTVQYVQGKTTRATAVLLHAAGVRTAEHVKIAPKMGAMGAQVVPLQEGYEVPRTEAGGGGREGTA